MKQKLLGLRISYSFLFVFLFAFFILPSFSQQPIVDVNDVKPSNFESNIKILLEDMQTRMFSLFSSGPLACQQRTISAIDFINAGLIAIMITMLIGFIRYALYKIFSTQQISLLSSIDFENIIKAMLFIIIASFLFESLKVRDNNTERYIFMVSASNYSEKMFINGLRAMSLIAIYTETINMLSYFSIPFKVPTTGHEINIAIGQIARPLIDTLSIIVPFITTASLSWAGIKILLCFIESFAFSYFLVLAFFLRSFFITKPIGDMLLSMAFGLFFIFPFVLHLNHVLYVYFLNDFQGFTWPQERFIATLSNLISIALIVTLSTSIFGVIGSIIFKTFSISGIFGMLSKFILLPAVFVFFKIAFIDVITMVVLHVVVFTIILMVMNLLIVGGFIKELSTIFGTSIDLSALLRLL